MASMWFFSIVRQCCILLFLMAGIVAPLRAQPVLTSFSPQRHTTATAAGSNIVLNWSTAMSTATLTGANIRVRSSMTASYSTGATYSYSSGNTVVSVNPALDFKAGELVSVTVTTGVRSSSGVAVTRATTWSFRTQTRLSAGMFGSGLNVEFGQAPFSVAFADLNNDGKLDLITGSPGGFSCAVSMGNGDGTFSGGSEVSTPLGTWGIALGDINNDGRLDLCTSNLESDNASIRLGNGSGGFTGTTNVSMGDGPNDIVLADFNGDGKLDMATANFYSNNVSVRLGNGNGTFGAVTNISSFGPINIHAGDVNNDGRIDLLMYNPNSFNTSIRLGNGNGTFASGITVFQDSGAGEVTLADMNRDGIPDIVFTNFFTNEVAVRLGDGTGGFDFPNSAPVGNGPVHMALNDLNGDGFLDVAVANYYDNTVSVRYGDGMGGLTGTTEVAMEISAAQLALGDVNNDGFLDLAATNNANNNVAVHLGLPKPPEVVSHSPAANALHVAPDTDISIVFSTTMNVSTLTTANIKIYGSMTGPVSASSVLYSATTQTIVLDPSIDFKPGELVSVIMTTGVKSAEGARPASATVWSFRIASEESSGYFSEAQDISVAIGIDDVVWGNINGDEHLDLVVCRVQEAMIYLGDGTGNVSYTSSVNIGYSLLTAALVDVNNDGNNDLVVSSSSDDMVSVRIGDGMGGFSGTTEVPTGSQPQTLVSGDVNGDGRLDIATLNTGDNTVSIRTGDAVGSFGGTTEIVVSNGSAPTDIDLADINNDGKLDLTTLHLDGSVSIRLGDGMGGFDNTIDLPAIGSAAYGLATGDVNGDGNLDLATTELDSGNVAIRLGDGTGNFSSAIHISLTMNPFRIALADADGDGDLDLAVAATAGFPNSVLVYTGDGTGNFTARDSLPVSHSTVMSFGDVNSDGILDIAVGYDIGQGVRVVIYEGAPYPSLRSFSPAANALGIAPSSDIALTFSTSMDVSSLTSANIRISGNMTGLYGMNSIAYSVTTNTVVFDPAVDFKPGELITVSVTTGVRSAGGLHITSATTWSFTVATGVSAGIFTSATNVATLGPNSPFYLNIADLDNDTDLDIVATRMMGALYVHLGNGVGGFPGTVPFFQVGSPASTVVDDLNGDGNLDLVMADLGASVIVFLGNGAGGFSYHTYSTVGYNPDVAAISDFNGDGNPDIIVNNRFNSTVSLCFTDGAGNIIDTTETPVGGNPLGLAIGDFNNDGKMDFATAPYDPGILSVYFGDGAGRFSDSTDVSVGAGAVRIATGDFNGDGNLDLATTNSLDNTVSVRFGDGAGNFSGNTEVPVGVQPYEIATGDLDGDGDLDFATISTSDSIVSVSVRFGDGAGNFNNSIELPANIYSRDIAFADLNGDGLLDIASLSSDNGGKISIFFGVPIPRVISHVPVANAPDAGPTSNTEIVFSTDMDAASLTSANIRLHGSQTGTLNTPAVLHKSTTNTLVLDPSVDFKPGELVSVSVTTGVQSAYGVHTTRATVWSFTAGAHGGAGEFGARFALPAAAPSSIGDAMTGDLDLDGDLDIFEANRDAAGRVLLNDGSGAFTEAWTGAPAWSGVLADLDGDGDLDAFTGTGSADLNTVWLNNGAGQFVQGWQDAVARLATPGVVVADFDGDGDIDLFECNTGGDSRVLINDGAGNFSQGWVRTASTDSTEICATAGDFDNDGDIDIFEVNSNEPGRLWLNDGAGNFTSGWMQDVTDHQQRELMTLASGDLDGDGDLDVIEGDRSRATVVWKNDGAGNFSPNLLSGSAHSVADMELGDFDDDGDLDVFIASRDMQHIQNTLYRNDGTGTFTAMWNERNYEATNRTASGDFDNDGDIDIATYYEAGQFVWLNERMPHLVVSVYPSPAASGGTIEFAVEIQREDGTPYAMPADTTVGVVLTHPSLVLTGGYSTQATIAVGASSTTITLRADNISAVAIVTTAVVALVNSGISATSAVVNIGPNTPPQISTTNAVVYIYENGTTTLTFNTVDAETVTAPLTVWATSANLSLLPASGITQVGATGAITSFAVVPSINAVGTVLVTATAEDKLFEVSTAVTLVVRPVAPPANLTVSAVNNGAALQWTPSTTPAVTAYAIYHGLTSGTLTFLATVSGTTTSYTHTGLTDGERHYYTMRALVSDNGYSAVTDEVSAIPNTLQVLYPNGGEVLQIGTLQMLRWQYSGNTTSMRIDYSTDNGSTWTPVIQLVTLSGNKPLTTFTQEWTVVDEPTTTALIRVVSLSPTTMEEQSDAVFSISEVTPPTNLAATAGSTTISLSWTASSSANISGYRILRGTTPNTLTELTTVGATTSFVDADVFICTPYYYAVRAVANSRASSNSNTANAQIDIADALIVASPNGGENWQAGTTQLIAWVSTGCTASSEVVIEYSLNGGANWALITTTANDGAYMWLVPNEPTSQALVRVIGGVLNDNSSSVFTITSIPAPADLAATAGDGSVELVWTASTAAGISGYSVYRGTSSGSLSLLADVSAASTTYIDNDAGNCTLLVYAVKANVGAMSSGFSNETTAAPQFTPALVIAAPNGGEVWQIGASYLISWTSTGCTIPSEVLMEYSADNGNNWTTIATTTNTGSYAWSVPDRATSQALVRISSGVLTDNSDVFAIAPIPAPATLAATAGDGSVELVWTASTAAGISGYSVYRRTTSGSLSLLANVSAASTGYADNSAQNCTEFVYAVQTNVGAMRSGFSNEAMAMPRITPVIAVTSPTGGEVWHGGQSRMITWTSTACTVPATVELAYSSDNGTSWSTIASVANTGMYEWDIAGVHSTQALVRVSDGTTSDRHKTTFTILPLPVPKIAAVQPVMTASYCPGGATPITVSVTLDDPIYPEAALKLRVTSSNQSIVADGNISQQGATGATTTFAFIPSATASGTAQLTITASNDYATASTTISVQAIVRSLPNTTITGSTTACAVTGDYSYRVLPVLGSIYNWTVTGGNITSGAGTNEIAVRWGSAGTGMVSITVTGNNSCQATNAVGVNIYPTPAPAIIAGGPTTLCAGGTVLLTAQPAGMVYEWSNGATTQSITATATGVYTVTVTSEHGCSAVSTGVSVIVLPEVTAEAGQNVVLCSGGSVRLEGSGASAFGILAFAWSPATGLSSTSVPRPFASPSETTTYTLTVTDNNGCTSTASVTVAVLPLPQTTISGGADICPGGSTQLHATGGSDYVWTPTTGLDNATIANPIASPMETTTYTVAITTTGGCTVMRSVTITVAPLPVANAGNDVRICAGGSAALQATGGVSYTWMPATGLDNPNIASPTANPTTTTVYTATVLNAAGCTSTATVTVTVLPVQLNVVVLLEGPYANGAMATHLRQQELIPAQQPYNIPPFNYAGTETLGVKSSEAIVDWVLLELRSGTESATIVERRAALLTNDGSIIAGNGQPVAFANMTPGDSYYVVVRHRNHLGVMSAVAVEVSNTCELLYNFTGSQSAAYSSFGSGHKEIGANVFGMIAGDVDVDGIINAVDRVALRNASGALGYLVQDITLDGIVNAADRVVVRNNAFMITQVP